MFCALTVPISGGFFMLHLFFTAFVLAFFLLVYIGISCISQFNNYGLYPNVTCLI